MATATGIMMAAFSDQGYRDGERYVELSAPDGKTVWDDASGMELAIDGTEVLIGNGERYDGECVRLVGPGGWYLCVPMADWERLGFALPE